MTDNTTNMLTALQALLKWEEQMGGFESPRWEQARAAVKAAQMSADLQAPVLNLNGTPADHLLEAYTSAGSALIAAQTALAQTCPHGRDYQTDRTGLAYARAKVQHEERAAKLRTIIGELAALAEHVSTQQDERRKP